MESSRAEERGEAAGGLLARLELGEPSFELGELRLCALEELSLHVEVLARHEVQPVEPARQQRAHVLLDVGRRRGAKRIVNAPAQILEQLFVDHASKLSPPGTSFAHVRRPSALLWGDAPAKVRVYRYKHLIPWWKFIGIGDARGERF